MNVLVCQARLTQAGPARVLDASVHPVVRHLRPIVVVALLVAGACTLRVVLHLPVRRADGQPIDPARLYVASVSVCDSMDAKAPRATPPAEAPPTPSTTDREHIDAKDPALPVVTLMGSGSSCYLHATLWDDANGNGTLDRGDALGSLPQAVHVEDKGLGWCGGTPTAAATLALSTVE